MPKHILVIDDEKSFRDAIQDILMNAGYRVEASPYLATAVGTAISGSYDLITLDLRMPGMDGLKIARLFRKLSLPTPVVVISGYLSDTTIEQLNRIGVQYILSKPADISKIVETVEKALT